MTWRPDASSKVILQKRMIQVRQVEENLKRLLLPLESNNKYEKRMEKSIKAKNPNEEWDTREDLMIPYRDMSLVNYETARFGTDGFYRKRSREEELKEEAHEDIVELTGVEWDGDVDISGEELPPIRPIRLGLKQSKEHDDAVVKEEDLLKDAVPIEDVPMDLTMDVPEPVVPELVAVDSVSMEHEQVDSAPMESNHAHEQLIEVTAPAAPQLPIVTTNGQGPMDIVENHVHAVKKEHIQDQIPVLDTQQSAPPQMTSNGTSGSPTLIKEETTDPPCTYLE